MNFSRLVIFLMFWNFIYATMHPALIIDWVDEKLVEVSKFDEVICVACLTACPVDPDSSTENLFNNMVSITKKSIFVRMVYPRDIPAKEMETEICKASFTPALAWNYDDETYEVGYELYYNRREISLFGDIEYEDFFNKEIEKNYTESEKFINIFSVSNDDEHVEFEILTEPGKKWTFNWISVLTLKISKDRRLRYILFDDTSKNFHTVTTNYYCKTYFGEDGMEIENTDGPEKDFGIEGFDIRTETKEKSPELGDRLVKAQIIPAHMFPTQAAQEATCVYLNFVFIWETIANGMLKKIDLFLYAIHLKCLENMKLTPKDDSFNTSGMIIRLMVFFGIHDYLQDFDPVTQKETTSEDDCFSTPNVIFRLLVFRKSNMENYGVVIIIHNDLEPIKDTDRICSTENEVKGWEYIKNTNSATGFSYTCPQTEEVLIKLGFDEEFVYKIMEQWKLDKFPITEEHITFLDRAKKRFEHITNLNAED